MGTITDKFDQIQIAIGNNNKALAKTLAGQGKDILCPEVKLDFEKVKQDFVNAGADPDLIANFQNKIDTYLAP